METQCRGGHRAAVCVRGGVSQLALRRQSDGRYPARQPAAAGGVKKNTKKSPMKNIAPSDLVFKKFLILL